MFRRRADRAARRGTPADWVIVGIANPGVEYRGTRHNLGGDAVEELARRLGAQLRPDSRLRARFAEVVTPGGARLLLAVPTTYVNESGAAVAPLVRRGGIGEDLGRLVVVHDELDLEPGRLQLRLGGGLAGHNGLRSIASALGSREFTRVRIGIGKPRRKELGADHVLSRPGRKEGELLSASVVEVADALEDLVAHGLDAAAARHNGAARG